MTERQEQILSELIKEYVKRAEPVSSNFLVEKCARLPNGQGFKCSPATIRAEMMNLEKEGFLVQPHTSAGRVPTDKAYRFIVDKLLGEEKKGEEEKNALPQKDRQIINETIRTSPQEPHAISSRLARAVAGLTNDFVISGILDTGDFYRVGVANILEMPEFEDIDNIFEFGSVFDGFEEHFNSLFNDFPGENLVVYIGRENPFKESRNGTVMVTRYPLPEGYEGISALIGPIRMAYDRNMALLKYVSKRMNQGKW